MWNHSSRDKWQDSCTSDFPSCPGSHQGQRSVAFPAFVRGIRRWKLNGLRSGILPRRRSGVKKIGVKKVGMKMVGTRAETGKKLGDVSDCHPSWYLFFFGFTPTEPGSMLWMYIVKLWMWSVSRQVSTASIQLVEKNVEQLAAWNPRTQQVSHALFPFRLSC